VRTLPLYDERYVLLAPDDGGYDDAEAVTWATAANERLGLLTPDMQNRRIIDGVFAAAGAEPRPVSRRTRSPRSTPTSGPGSSAR
jgi:DNA-binding transcriptional LysR family regulator